MDSSKFMQNGSVLEVNLDKVMEEGSKVMLGKVLLEQADHAAGAEGAEELEKMAVSSNEGSDDALADTHEDVFKAEFKEKLKKDKAEKTMLKKAAAEEKMKELKAQYLCKELLDQLAEKGMGFLKTGKEEWLQAIEDKFGLETREIHAKCVGKNSLQVWLTFLRLLIVAMELQLAQTGKVSKELVYKAIGKLDEKKGGEKQLNQACLVQSLNAVLSQDHLGSLEVLTQFKQLCQPMLEDLEEEIFTQISVKVAANLLGEIGYKLKEADYGAFQILGNSLILWSEYLKCTPNKYTAEAVALEKNCKGKLLMLDARITLEALGIQGFLSEASCFKLNTELASSFAMDVLGGLKNESQGFHCQKPHEVEGAGKVKSSIKALDSVLAKEFSAACQDFAGAFVDVSSQYEGAGAGTGDYKALANIILACSKENLVQLGHLQHEVSSLQWSSKELEKTFQKIQEVMGYAERRFMDAISKQSCFERTVFHGFDDHQENCMPQILRDKLLQRSLVKQKELQLSMNLPLCFTFLRKFICGRSLAWEETVKEFDMVLKKPWEVKEISKKAILIEEAKKDVDLKKQLEKAEKDAEASLLLAKVIYAEEHGPEEAEDKVAEKFYDKDTKDLKVVLTQLERAKYYWRGQDALKQLEWVKKQPYTKGSEKYTF